MGYTLIVDDEPESVQLLATTLEGIGVATRSAFDGSEALACIEQEAPDLIVLDLMMPLMSGVEVLSRLKMNPRMADVPVIVVSAYTDQVEDSQIASVRQVMAKGSFGTSDIRAAVRSALDMN